MIDLALDTKTHDMVFALDDRGASIAFVISGPAVVQRIKMRLLSIYGEWFLDTRFGTPWFEQILVKNPQSQVVESIFRLAILGVTGVDKLTRLVLVFDRRTRALSVDAEVVVEGSVIQFNSDLRIAQRSQ